MKILDIILTWTSIIATLIGCIIIGIIVYAAVTGGISTNKNDNSSAILTIDWSGK